MIELSSEAWIMIIGALVGVSCSLLGVFLVLRKMSMFGDAISHSVLLGIVGAFLLTSSRSTAAMLAGAVIVGVFTAYLSSALNKHASLQEDASIGVTFTWLFAVGVILISIFAGQVDIDQDCVLFGEIAFAPLDTVVIGHTDYGPRIFWILLFSVLINLMFIIFGFRSLKIISFDKLLAHSVGINVTLWHYLFMTFVSITTVASFEAVGAILVVAMLVVPANAAFLITKSLKGMLFVSAFIAILSSIFGYYLAEYFDASISAAIAICSGIIFIGILAFNKIKEISRPRNYEIVP